MMAEKPKRKNQYRRWWAFRGLILALIIFLGSLGYLLTRESKGEYIFYQVAHSYVSPDSGTIMQVNVNTLESKKLTSSGSSNFSIGDFLVSGDGQILVYLESELDFGNRAFVQDIETGKRKFLFDCIEWSGNCYLETLNYDGSRVIFRVVTGQTIWYEMDLSTGERFVLAQLDHFCIHSTMIYQSLIVVEACGYGRDTYYIINYETGETTTLDGYPILSDDTTQYAYTVPSIIQSDYPIYENLPLPVEQEIYIGERNNVSAIQLLDIQRVNTVEDWHPDNERLLVSTYTEEYNSDGGYEFILYNVKTGKQTSLLYMRGTHLSQARWNSTGTHIVYILSPMYGLDHELDMRVYVYELASGETWQVGFSGMFPQWVD